MNAQLHYSAREFTTIHHVTKSYIYLQGSVLAAITSSHALKCIVTTLLFPDTEIQRLCWVMTKTIQKPHKYLGCNSL